MSLAPSTARPRAPPRPSSATSRSLAGPPIGGGGYSKERNVPEQHEGEWGFGDVWTWVALDPDTKLVCSWLIGRRDGAAAMDFLTNLGPRLRNRVQITTDGH